MANAQTRLAEILLELTQNEDLMEVGRKAIEDKLIEFRDARISELMRHNGFCVAEQNGSPSSIIRFGPEVGVTIALKAIAEHVKELK